MRRLKEMFPQELVVIGVHSAKFSSEQLTAGIRQAANRQGIEHPVVNDAGFKIWNAYAVRAWPTLVLIDPRGRIAGEVSGEILAEEFAENIREVIEQNRDLLSLEPPDRPEGADIEPERPLRYPARLLLVSDRLFIADTGHHRILEVKLDEDGLGGEVVRVFGSGLPGMADGAAEEARFFHPHGMGLGGGPLDGTLWVADTENHAVRAVSLSDGRVRTVAGTGQKAHGRRSLGIPLETSLRSPWAVLPIEKYLFIAMAGSHQIWVMIEEAQLGPFAGNGAEDLVDGLPGEASFNQPSDLAFGGGYLFVADPEASAVRAISLVESPRVVTLVGQGLFDWGDQDGSTGAALLQHPVGLAYADGLLYVADTYNNKIKVLDPAAGTIRTLIGSGLPFNEDGSFETCALFEPEGVQVHQGRLYIADTNNHLVRVGDLHSRRVRTFTLRGLEWLPASPAGMEQSAELLGPRAAAPGPVRIVLDVTLPDGYARSAEAPAVVELGGGVEAARLVFLAGRPIAWTVDVGSDVELSVDLALYYCQERDARLCLIHRRRLAIPLSVDPQGSSTIVIPYPIRAFD